MKFKIQMLVRLQTANTRADFTAICRPNKSGTQCVNGHLIHVVHEC